MAESGVERRLENGDLGWIYVRTRSNWKRRFLVILEGNLQMFSSDQRNHIKKIVNLVGSQVYVVGLPSSEKSAGEPVDSQPWEKFLREPFPDQCFSCDTTVVVIQPYKGKSCCLLALNQKEANSWKASLEEAEAVFSKASERHSKMPSSPGGSNGIMSRAASVLRRSFGSNKKVDACREDTVENLKNNSEGNEGLVKNNQQDSKLVKTDVLHLDPLWPELDTLQGCTDFLRSNCLHAHGLEHARFMIDHFKGCYQMGDSSLSDEFRLEAWKGTMRRIIKALVDQLIMCNPSLESCMINDEHMNQLWLACEAWIFGAVHDKIMGACKQMFSMKDRTLDETLARLEKVDPSVLGVRGGFENFVLGEALYQFKLMNRFKTPLEKAICLRKTVNCILEGIHSLIKSCTGALQDTGGLLPCTDDLLSFMVLLMARAKVTNLQANACYMENFLYINKEDGEKGELGFHITNFVAACNYLQSKEMKDIASCVTLKHGHVSSPSGMPASTVNDVNMIVGEDFSCQRTRVSGSINARQWSEASLLNRRGGMTFPGDSPDFILASTYE